MHSLIILWYSVRYSFIPEQKGLPQLEKFYFLNVTKVEYMRETLEPSFPSFSTHQDHQIKDTPNHRLVVHNLKVKMTLTRR